MLFVPAFQEQPIRPSKKVKWLAFEKQASFAKKKGNDFLSSLTLMWAVIEQN